MAKCVVTGKSTISQSSQSSSLSLAKSSLGVDSRDLDRGLLKELNLTIFLLPFRDFFLPMETTWVIDFSFSPFFLSSSVCGGSIEVRVKVLESTEFRKPCWEKSSHTTVWRIETPESFLDKAIS